MVKITCRGPCLSSVQQYVVLSVFNRIFILDETLQLFRLAVVNVCPVLLPSESLLSTHLPTSEGWTAELTVGLWLVVPTTGFEPTRVDLV